MADTVKSTEVPSVASARARRALSEHERVRKAFDLWLKGRRDEDAKQCYQQYSTQLASLEKAIHAAFSSIAFDLSQVGASSPPTVQRVFTLCAKHDLRLAWVQRLWFYFRHKFDQRDDPLLAPALKAADEIVWSCYKPAFEQLGKTPPAAPLPYLEPLYSPQAILRVEPPRELLWNTDDAFARSCLTSLPIPVISVPTSVVSSPWLLGLLAHEVGHHVQADLDGGEGTQVRSFGDALAAAASGAARPEVWLARGREVFADVFSLLAIGSSASPVLADLLLDDNASMLLSFDNRYPAPQVRLALLHEVASALGLPAAENPHSLTFTAPNDLANLPPAAQLAAHEWPILPALAKAALGWKHQKGLSFPGLLGWSETSDSPPEVQSLAFGEAGPLAGWCKTFVDGNSPVAPSQLESPRHLAGAGVQAWAQLIVIDDEAERQEALSALAVSFLAAVSAYREQKTRAGETTALIDGTALADRLMSATEAELGAFPNASTAPLR